MLTVVYFFVYLIWGVLKYIKAVHIIICQNWNPSLILKEEPKDLLALQLDLKGENHLKISLTLKRIMGTGQKAHDRHRLGYNKQGQ